MRDWFILVLYTIWYVISFGCFRRNVIEPTDFLNRKEISNREAENALRDFYREKSRDRKDSLREWDVEFTKSLLDDNTLYLNFTEYMTVMPNGNYVEWSILFRSAQLSNDTDPVVKALPKRYGKSLPNYLDLLQWENDYLREVTGETIYGVIEYVQDGTDTIGLDSLKHNLANYKTLGYGSVIDNFVKATGSTAWRFGDQLVIGTITADKLTTSRPLYTHSDL